MSSEIVDAEVVENGNGQEIVPAAPPHPPSTLFHTDDPIEVIERASKAAEALKSVIERQQLFKNIGGKDHVLVEGWTTLGSMLGVVPVVTWSKQAEPKTEHGYSWEARVEARTLDGRIIGAAEATCSRKERTWATRDDYALRSMAQTRATSKALRGPLGFVVTLAGYSATPAEEMTPVETTNENYAEHFEGSIKAEHPLPAKRVEEVLEAIRMNGVKFSRLGLMFGKVGAQKPEKNSVKSISEALANLTPAQADKLQELAVGGQS